MKRVHGITTVLIKREVEVEGWATEGRAAGVAPTAYRTRSMGG